MFSDVTVALAHKETEEKKNTDAKRMSLLFDFDRQGLAVGKTAPSTENNLNNLFISKLEVLFFNLANILPTNEKYGY